MESKQTKRCDGSLCGGAELPVQRFRVNSRKCQNSGLRRICRRCERHNVTLWEKANPEKHRRNRAMRERRAIEKLYGITIEEYQAMLLSQSGRCKVCGVEASTLKRAMAVDHDHSTGLVRGLLCNNCNRGIGLLKDNPAIVRAALVYLESFAA